MNLGDPVSDQRSPVTAPTSTPRLPLGGTFPGCPAHWLPFTNPSNGTGGFHRPVRSFLTSLPLLGGGQRLSTGVPAVTTLGPGCGRSGTQYAAAPTATPESLFALLWYSVFSKFFRTKSCYFCYKKKALIKYRIKKEKQKNPGLSSSPIPSNRTFQDHGNVFTFMWSNLVPNHHI